MVDARSVAPCTICKSRKCAALKEEIRAKGCCGGNDEHPPEHCTDCPDVLDAAVMARLRAPFGCEFIEDAAGKRWSRWRIHDANDDAVASVSGLEEGYARLIVQALNEHFERRSTPPARTR